MRECLAGTPLGHTNICCRVQCGWNIDVESLEQAFHCIRQMLNIQQCDPSHRFWSLLVVLFTTTCDALLFELAVQNIYSSSVPERCVFPVVVV